MTSTSSERGLRSLSEACAGFSFEQALAELAMGPDGAVNAAEICCDRHADDPARVALRHRSVTGETRDWTFSELRQRSSQLARAFATLGIGKGDRVSGLLPRAPELLITVLAAWRLGAVYQPLFTAFGPKAIEHRVATAGSKIVVTDTGNRQKLAETDLDVTIVTVGGGEGQDHDFWALLDAEQGDLAPVACGVADPFLMMFTSGTTGLPKSLLVPIHAIAAFMGYMRDAVDLRPEDRFWNLADPGWAYGLYYAVTGPLACGQTTVFHEGGFSVDSAYDTIVEYGITNLAGSPTAYRMLMGAGTEKAARIKGRLRAVSSAGEPLNPEIIRWFDQALDAPIHDHYGQTELGMVLCNHHALEHPVNVGSAGYSSPGYRVVVLSSEKQELPPGEPGDLAVDRGQSPLLWFEGYLGMETPSLGPDYYLTGDTAELNEDGSISFVGRADDVITTSGYRVGPFDVESALIEHEAVLESAVVGKPDPERTELIKAFVVLQPGFAPGDELAETLRLHVKARLSAHAYPREFEFVDSLPKTPSGKVQRFLLRNQEVAKAAVAKG